MMMRRSCAAALVLCAANAFAATPYKPPVEIVYEHRRIELAPDASSTMTTASRLKLLNSAAIAHFGQERHVYSELTQQLDITEAYTLKADGRKIMVQPDAIITQQGAGLPDNISASDQKQKLIIYPDLQAGDTVANTRVLKAQPQVPGLFSWYAAYPPTVPNNDLETTFVTPKSLPLYSDSKGVTIEKTAEGDKLIYTVRVKTSPVAPVAEYMSVFDRAPYYAVSTLKDWTAFAKIYGDMILPKIVVSEKIQAKADEITAGITDKREQVRKIKDWVSSHIRYVAVELGVGGIVPHDPESVLFNAYGDCKDHAALFSALAKAKGIESELVLIDGKNGYTVPSVPGLVFNHMINYVPFLGLYIDTTSRSQALGFLPRTEYGKTAIHIGGQGNPVHRVPILEEKDFVFQYSEQQRLDASGTLTGTGTMVGTGFAAAYIRGVAREAEISGAEKFASDVLTRRGLHGASGMYELPDKDDREANYTISGHYSAPNQSGWLKGKAFVLSRGLAIASLTSDAWLGPIAEDKYKDADVMPCQSMKGSEDYSLTLPGGKTLVKLPDDETITAEGLNYTSHWAMKGQSVLLHRELTLHFSEPLCRGAQRKAIADALGKMRTDAGTTLTLKDAGQGPSK